MKSNQKSLKSSPRNRETSSPSLSMCFKSVDRENTVLAILQKASKNSNCHYHPSFTQVEKRAPAFAIGDRSLQRSLETSNERRSKTLISGAHETDGSILLKGLLGAMTSTSKEVQKEHGMVKPS
jgi:ATPase subunit of ABC transporter with duplicated ATPase domains